MSIEYQPSHSDLNVLNTWSTYPHVMNHSTFCFLKFFVMKYSQNHIVAYHHQNIPLTHCAPCDTTLHPDLPGINELRSIQHILWWGCCIYSSHCGRSLMGCQCYPAGWYQDLWDPWMDSNAPSRISMPYFMPTTPHINMPWHGSIRRVPLMDSGR